MLIENKPWGFMLHWCIMDKLNERLAGGFLCCSSTKGRMGRFGKNIASSSRDGRKTGRWQVSHSLIRTLLQSRKEPRSKEAPQDHEWHQRKLRRTICFRTSLLQSQFSCFIILTTWFCWRKATALRSRSEIRYDMIWYDMIWVGRLTTFLRRRKEISRGDCFIIESLPTSDGYCCALIGSVSRNQPTPGGAIRDVLLRDCNESSVALFRRGEGLSVKF